MLSAFNNVVKFLPIKTSLSVVARGKHLTVVLILFLVKKLHGETACVETSGTSSSKIGK